MQENRASAREHMSIFEQPWWLSAATDGKWEQAEVTWDNRRVGWMPYYVKTKLGRMTIITNPPYTRTITPRFYLPASKPYRSFENQVKVLKELTEQLPRHHRLELILEPHSEAVYPFVQLGYTVATTYTFRLPTSADPNEVWAGLDQKTRNLIKTAKSKLAADFHSDIHRFINLSQEQHKHSDRNDYTALENLWAASSERKQSTILSIVDSHGTDVASSILVWDDKRLYYLASTRDTLKAGNNAISLLLWEAIMMANSLGLEFDSDSYGSVAAAKFLARFGLNPVIRNVVNKSGALWKVLATGRSLLHSGRDDQPQRV
jgi:hypothetical protein